MQSGRVRSMVVWVHVRAVDGLAVHGHDGCVVYDHDGRAVHGHDGRVCINWIHWIVSTGVY